MPQITVNARSACYPLYIERGVLDTLGGKIAKALPGARAVVVSDETVYELYGARAKESLARAEVPSDSVVLPPGEETKSSYLCFSGSMKQIGSSFPLSRTDVDRRAWAGRCYVSRCHRRPAALLAATYLGVSLMCIGSNHASDLRSIAA